MSYVVLGVGCVLSDALRRSGEGFGAWVGLVCELAVGGVLVVFVRERVVGNGVALFGGWRGPCPVARLDDLGTRGSLGAILVRARAGRGREVWY
ncbi:hypothetical protein [Nonomuraea sp. NPDC049625]|uniref:hypothetical protein n=1 Tax=Nonomuraea sp. NPDC049625 TaxID=3155775 RepID=UPI00343FACA7